MTTSNPIQILLKNENNIEIIKSPVKYEILDLLKDREMNFEEIVKNTSKTKAATSLHLKNLREAGIMNYKPDPMDNRKKIFYLNSKMLGSIDDRNIKLENSCKKMVLDLLNEKSVQFNLLLMHILKTTLIEYGIDLNPLLITVGNHIGEYIFEKVHDSDFDRFLENISGYWAENNLGFLSFNVKNTIEIICMENFESSKMENADFPQCHIMKGIFEEIFTRYFNIKISVMEIMCQSTGDEICLFEVKPV